MANFISLLLHLGQKMEHEYLNLEIPVGWIHTTRFILYSKAYLETSKSLHVGQAGCFHLLRIKVICLSFYAIRTHQGLNTGLLGELAAQQCRILLITVTYLLIFIAFRAARLVQMASCILLNLNL